jgi:hypothetical protein
MNPRSRYRAEPAWRLVSTSLITLLAWLPALPGNAENSEPEQEAWYQVEVIVYRNNSPGNENLEQWPQDIVLDYPEPLVFLIDPGATMEQPLLETDIPASFPIPTEETLEVDELANSEEVPAGDITPFADGNELTVTEPRQTELPMEKPFTLLEDEQRQQNSAAAKINSSPYLKVLFHQAWRQIVPDRDSPSHILITGGERYGEHYELEGSISISKARYLHLASNLWLNEFIVRPAENTLNEEPAENPDENDETGNDEFSPFITLPPVPAKPAEPPTAEAEPFPPGLAPDLVDGLIPSPDTISPAATQATGPGTEMQLPPPDPDTALPLFQLSEEEIDFIFDEQLVPDYVSVRTVKMSEHRRLRSKELHYLDHPMLGILISITPYEIETGQDGTR